MKKMLFLLLILNAAPAWPLSGHDQGGGGDPLAIEFLEKARYIAIVLQNNEVAGIQISSRDFTGKVDAIDASLDGQSPLLTFPPGDVLNCYGSPKLGCVMPDQKIQLAREGWQHSSEIQKYQLVAMELLLSLGQSNRYDLAAVLTPDTAFAATASHVNKMIILSPLSKMIYEPAGPEFRQLTGQEGSNVAAAIYNAMGHSFNCRNTYVDGKTAQTYSLMRGYFEPIGEAIFVSGGSLLRTEENSGPERELCLLSTDSTGKTIIKFECTFYKRQGGAVKNVGTIVNPRQITFPEQYVLFANTTCTTK